MLLMSLMALSCVEDKDMTNCKIIKMHGLTEEKLDDSIDEIFQNKKYIILDNSQEEYPAVIVDILYRDNKLFMHSRVSRSDQLLVFKDNGEFLFKVSNKGKAKNEYLNINSFDVNNIGEIIINDTKGGKILKFDDNGQFIAVIKHPLNDIYSLKSIGNDGFLYSLADWGYTDPKIELIKMQDNEKTIYSYYGEYIDVDMQIMSPKFTVAGDDIYFANNLSDTLYVFNKYGNLENKIYLDFGSRAVPQNDKINLIQKIDYQQIYKEYTTLNSFCCVYNEYVYGGLYDGMERKFFVLNQSKEKIYTVNYDNYSKVGQIIGFDGKYLVSYLDYVTHKHNNDYFDGDILKALMNDQTVICLYYN